MTMTILLGPNPANFPTIECIGCTADALLDLTADAIERHGWRRGAYGTLEDGLCFAGAMYVALGYAPFGPKLVDSVSGTGDISQMTNVVEATIALANDVAPGWDVDQPEQGFFAARAALIRWNDQQRDKRKVLRALRRVARNLRSAS